VTTANRSVENGRPLAKETDCRAADATSFGEGSFSVDAAERGKPRKPKRNDRRDGLKRMNPRLPFGKQRGLPVRAFDYDGAMIDVSRFTDAIRRRASIKPANFGSLLD
jgi:hypothetical protein